MIVSSKRNAVRRFFERRFIEINSGNKKVPLFFSNKSRKNKNQIVKIRSPEVSDILEITQYVFIVPLIT